MSHMKYPYLVFINTHISTPVDPPADAIESYNVQRYLIPQVFGNMGRRYVF